MFPTSDNYLAKSLLKTHTQEVRIFILLSGMKVTFSVDAGTRIVSPCFNVIEFSCESFSMPFPSRQMTIMNESFLREAL